MGTLLGVHPIVPWVMFICMDTLFMLIGGWLYASFQTTWFEVWENLAEVLKNEKWGSSFRRLNVW